MAKKTRHILVMKSGREIPITGITGRYYITRESQYRKETRTYERSGRPRTRSATR